jgi:hypothetical protein
LVGPEQTNWIRKVATPEQICEIMRESKISWSRILERQSAWSEFAEQIRSSSPFKVDKGLNTVTGRMDQGGFTLGFAALNTSWSAIDKDDQGELWIGEFQRQTIQQSISSADFKVVVTHSSRKLPGRKGA